MLKGTAPVGLHMSFALCRVGAVISVKVSSELQSPFPLGDDENELSFVHVGLRAVRLQAVHGAEAGASRVPE